MCLAQDRRVPALPGKEYPAQDRQILHLPEIQEFPDLFPEYLPETARPQGSGRCPRLPGRLQRHHRGGRRDRALAPDGCRE